MKRIAHRYSLLLAGALLFADQLAAQEWQGTYSSSGGSSAVVYKVEMLYYSAGGSGNDSDDGWELIGKLNLSLRDGSNASVKDFGAFAAWTGGKVTKGRHDWSSLQYFYCGSPESMNGGRVVISGSGLVDEDSGDSDDGISTPEQSTPLSGLTAGGAARSFSSSYNWTSKALVMDDGQGSLSINGKVSLIAIDDVPQAQRGNIDCGAEAAGKFKIVKTPGGTLLVTATASDFTGNMKPLGQVIAGTYTDYGGDYARNAGEFRFHMNGGSVTFYYKGKPYNFNREAGAASNVIQLPGQASGGSSAIGKWYGANVGDAGVDIMAGVDHELAFWVGDKSYDFDLAETQPSKVTKQYAQAGGSATMKVSKLKLTINGVEYYRDAPIAGKSRGGSGSAGMDVFSLVRTGDLETIAELKEEGMADLEARNSTGQTPLLAAAAMNNGDVVSGLIGLGASATAVGSDGKSALDHAAAKGNLDMVRTLMAAGCKATAPMIDAASAKPEVVMELVSGSNDPGLGSYAVTVASKKGNTELFKSLVETQSVPLSIAHFNNAVSDRRMEIALYVLEAPGIDMNAALTTSLGSGLRPLIERCLNKGASPAPALEYAVRKGDLDLTNLILSDYNGVATPVMPIAVGKGNIALVTALLDHDGDATAGLQAAVDSNKVAIARLLLGRGADPNKEMGNAARRGYDDLIKAMLENNGAADSGMQGAIEGDKPNTVTLLVNSGADPNPAMAYAVDKSYGTLLELLISKGGDATVSAYVATAAERGDVAILNILLEKGSASADPGMLPAVTNQGAGVVDILLKHGASRSSPVLIQKSVERGEVTTAGLLLNSGADASPADRSRSLFPRRMHR
ncbi:MAG: ankyrin repeat domain-containing protein [Flavobacteriales bacterium]|nr:ankyrin repeat domain-containing protein [Flavobacteriales bacterium]